MEAYPDTSENGTSPTSINVRFHVAIGGKADVRNLRVHGLVDFGRARRRRAGGHAVLRGADGVVMSLTAFPTAAIFILSLAALMLGRIPACASQSIRFANRNSIQLFNRAE